MKRKRLLSLLLALAMALTVLPAAGALAAGEEYAQNTGDAAVKIYTTADEASEPLGELAAGEKAAYLGASGEWYKVRKDEIEGYVKASSMTLLEPKLTATGGSFAYDGKEHAVVAKVENAEGYTIEYSTDNGASWGSKTPSLTNAGKLTVKVRAIKSGAVTLTCADVTLEVKAEPKLTATGGSFAYDGKEHAVVAKVENAEGYAIEYSIDNGTSWGSKVPSLTNAGKLTVKVRAIKSGAATLTCADVTLEVTGTPEPKLTITGGKYPYDGKPHTVTYKLENADGYTVTYSTDGGSKWSATAPTLTDPGKLTVKVKASKKDQKDLIAEVVLEITPATTTATVATVVNCNEFVNVRKGPSSSTTKLGTAKKGAQFKMLGVEGDWYKLQYTASQVGYIHKTYISTKSVTETPDTPEIKPAGDNEIVTIVNCKNSVNVRSGAGTNYSLVGAAPKGAQYKLLARVNVGSVTWFKVQYATGKDGYIHEDYIKTGTGTPSTPTTGHTLTIVNCNESVNVREGASSSTKKLGEAKKGSVYTYLGRTVDGKWYQIQYTATQKGFVYSQYVKVNSGTVTPPDDDDKPATGKTATIVNCNEFVNVREGASSSTKKLGTAKKGAQYTVTGQSGSWIQVQYTATQKGYIYSKYVKLSDSGSTTPTTPTETTATGYGYVVNCSNSVNVRSGAGTNHSIIGTAPKSQVYQILGRSGNWYKVQFKSSTVGYIHDNYFSKATGDTTQKAKVINCTTDVNVRSAAATSSALIGKAKLGETFTFLKMMNNYAMVIYDGRVGCIHKNYVQVG